MEVLQQAPVAVVALVVGAVVMHLSARYLSLAVAAVVSWRCVLVHFWELEQLEQHLPSHLPLVVRLLPPALLPLLLLLLLLLVLPPPVVLVHLQVVAPSRGVALG